MNRVKCLKISCEGRLGMWTDAEHLVEKLPRGKQCKSQCIEKMTGCSVAQQFQ